MRRFKYLGPTDDRYKKNQLVDYDGVNSTPDGGVAQEYWIELVDQPEGGD